MGVGANRKSAANKLLQAKLNAVSVVYGQSMRKRTDFWHTSKLNKARRNGGYNIMMTRAWFSVYKLKLEIVPTCI